MNDRSDEPGLPWFLGSARAGCAVDAVLDRVRRFVTPGVAVASIEQLAAADIDELGATPTMLGLDDGQGGGAFPVTISISINDEIMGGHRAGSATDRVVQTGDLVTADLALSVAGWHADTAMSWVVGEACEERRRLVGASRAVTTAGVRAAAAGTRWEAVAGAMRHAADDRGVALLRGYDGHGIGRSMHQAPRLPSHPEDFDRLEGDGVIRAGQVFTIEPVVGLADTGVVREGWLDRTRSGTDACFTEVTVAVGHRRNLVLAGRCSWRDGHDLSREGV